MRCDICSGSSSSSSTLTHVTGDIPERDAVISDHGQRFHVGAERSRELSLAARTRQGGQPPALREARRSR
jgi:hypothetical protein